MRVFAWNASSSTSFLHYSASKITLNHMHKQTSSMAIVAAAASSGGGRIGALFSHVTADCRRNLLPLLCCYY